jgi:hypothetical protein
VLNILLIIKKDLINIISLFEQIYPGKLCKIINKAYIIGMFSHGKRIEQGPILQRILVPKEQ